MDALHETRGIRIDKKQDAKQEKTPVNNKKHHAHLANAKKASHLLAAVGAAPLEEERASAGHAVRSRAVEGVERQLGWAKPAKGYLYFILVRFRLASHDLQDSQVLGGRSYPRAVPPFPLQVLGRGR